jgi:Ca2+-binding EF-hand superfamily protein
MNKKLSTLIGGIALISSAAFAQTTTGQSPSSSSPSDSSGATSSQQDSSGMDTTGSQSSSVVPQGFSSLDKDSSGEISRREAASQQSLSRIFDRADENKDGQLSQNEYQKALAPEDSSSVVQ